MKRKLLFASALISTLAAASAWAGGPEVVVEPDYFSGFFVGGTGAFHMAGFSGGSSAVTPNAVSLIQTFPTTDAPVAVAVNQLFFPAGTLTSGNVTGNSYDGYYGAQGGAGKVFGHRWYTGFVAFGEWGTQTNTQVSAGNFQNVSSIQVNEAPGGSVAAPPINTNNVNTNGTYQSSTTVKLSSDYGVAFKPGFLPAPKTMIYGKIGAVWANLQVTNTFNGVSHSEIQNSGGITAYTADGTLSGSSSDKDKKIALLLGVGFEQFIYKNFITVGMEYDYANYGHVSTSTPLQANESLSGTTTGMTAFADENTVDNAGFAQASASARVSTLMGFINFYFGSQWF